MAWFQVMQAADNQLWPLRLERRRAIVSLSGYLAHSESDSQAHNDMPRFVDSRTIGLRGEKASSHVPFPSAPSSRLTALHPRSVVLPWALEDADQSILPRLRPGRDKLPPVFAHRVHVAADRLLQRDVLVLPAQTVPHRFCRLGRCLRVREHGTGSWRDASWPPQRCAADLPTGGPAEAQQISAGRWGQAGSAHLPLPLRVTPFSPTPGLPCW